MWPGASNNGLVTKELRTWQVIYLAGGAGWGAEKREAGCQYYSTYRLEIGNQFHTAASEKKGT